MHTGFLNTGPDGRFVHSFYPAPAVWCCATHVLGLPEETDRQGAAAHEAGHAVAAFVVGIHVIGITLTTEREQQPCGPAVAVSGVTDIGPLAVPVDGYLTMLAAGEAAHRRWLRESGLYSADRAWAVECGALDDTGKGVDALREQVPELEDTGYRQLFWRSWPAAEALVDAHWNRVLAVAAGLARLGRLSGAEAAALAGLPNPPEPGPAQGCPL